MSDSILNFQNHYLKMSSVAHLCVQIYLSLLGQLASVHFLSSPPSSLLRKLTIPTTEKRELLRDCKQIPERGDTTAQHRDQKLTKHRKEDNQEVTTLTRTVTCFTQIALEHTAYLRLAAYAEIGHVFIMCCLWKL